MATPDSVADAKKRNQMINDSRNKEIQKRKWKFLLKNPLSLILLIFGYGRLVERTMRNEVLLDELNRKIDFI
ncbi:MAG: hypothetical protein JWM20_282 [Patescibacteria group bacterium]|nr:hypothetical protein [Patescibacteria group bacterium]